MSELERLRRRCNELENLLESGTRIAQDLRLHSVLNRVVHQAIQVSAGEAGTLWLADEQQSLAPVVIIGGASRDQLAKMRLAPGEGVAGRVYGSGQPLIIHDVHNHPRWAKRFDSATGFRTNSILCTPLFARGRRLGALQIINKAGGGFFQDDDLHLLTALSNQASLIIDASLTLQHTNGMITSFIEAITDELDARNPYLLGHSAKVAEYCAMIGQEMYLSTDDMEKLRRAALLHDIGKINITELILNKATPLTPEETAVLDRHAVRGAEILSRIKPASMLPDVVPAVRHHHERVDGDGFPDGLIGDKIPLFARIIAVADTFYHLTTDRPFRRALSPEAAIEELGRQSGSRLDAELVRTFVSAYNKKAPAWE